MADNIEGQTGEVKTVNENTQTQPPDNKELSNDEKISILIDEKVKPMIEENNNLKKLLDTAKKENSGLDKKVTEMMKKLKEEENKKLTDEQKLELKEKELQDGYQKLWRERAIAKHNFILSEKESSEISIDFSEYLFGDNEDVILQKAEALKKYIDFRISKGIEIGVEERISKGYIPKTSVDSKTGKSYSNMTRDELIEETKKISKMPDSLEKSKKLKELSDENTRRLK